MGLRSAHGRNDKYAPDASHAREQLGGSAKLDSATRSGGKTARRTQADRLGSVGSAARRDQANWGSGKRSQEGDGPHQSAPAPRTRRRPDSSGKWQRPEANDTARSAKERDLTRPGLKFCRAQARCFGYSRRTSGCRHNRGPASEQCAQRPGGDRRGARCGPTRRRRFGRGSRPDRPNRLGRIVGDPPWGEINDGPRHLTPTWHRRT